MVSNWSGPYFVGYDTAFNLLRVENQGELSHADALVGYEATAVNNTAIVDGSGSIWKMDFLVIGRSGSGSQVVVTNGGHVENASDCWVGSIGASNASSNNSVTVAGAGSVWSNGGNVTFGERGAGNLLQITGGGAVYDNGANVGEFLSDGNTVIVSDSGSVWSNRAGIFFGDDSAGNRLVITNGGAMSSAFGYIGTTEVATNNVVRVTGAGSVWVNRGGSVYVGWGAEENRLEIADGGTVSSQDISIGYSWNAHRNLVSISGSNSLMKAVGSLDVGYSSSGNSLTIQNGAATVDDYGNVGHFSGGDAGGNFVLVTGPGSVWSNLVNCWIGPAGSGNSLVISNGGRVFSRDGYLGFDPTGSTNAVTVAGEGSAWQIPGELFVAGSRNRLEIRDDGFVIASNAYVNALPGWPANVISVLGGNLDVSSGSIYIGHGLGWDGRGELVVSNGTLRSAVLRIGNEGLGTFTAAGGVMNVSSAIVVGTFNCSGGTGRVEVTGGSLYVTNASHSATVEVQTGTFTQTGGAVWIDRLVVTNDCGRFIRTGGSLNVSTYVLGPSFDTDNDGLPNDWEQSHGFDPLAPNGDDDFDGDGLSNLQEFMAGTDPTNSASVFGITGITPEGNDMCVTWATAANKTNALQATGFPATNFSDIFIVTNTLSATTNYVDSGAATNSPVRLYRVRLVP